MAQVTPVTALPADSDTTGAVQITGTGLRAGGNDAVGGAASVPAPRGTASVNARLTVLRGTASVNARLQRCQEALETARDVLVDKLADDKPATIAQGIAAVCKELRALHELGLRETAALCSWIGSDWAGIGNNQ